MAEPDTITARVRTLAAARGLSLRELAGRAGVSHQAVSNRGLGNPTLATLAALARALGVPLAELVGGLERPTP